MFLLNFSIPEVLGFSLKKFSLYCRAAFYGMFMYCVDLFLEQVWYLNGNFLGIKVLPFIINGPPKNSNLVLIEIVTFLDFPPQDGFIVLSHLIMPTLSVSPDWLF